jgi:hypothetical protein
MWCIRCPYIIPTGIILPLVIIPVLHGGWSSVCFTLCHIDNKFCILRLVISDRALCDILRLQKLHCDITLNDSTLKNESEGSIAAHILYGLVVNS